MPAINNMAIQLCKQLTAIAKIAKQTLNVAIKGASLSQAFRPKLTWRGKKSHFHSSSAVSRQKKQNKKHAIGCCTRNGPQRQVMSRQRAWVWLRQGNHLSEKQVGEKKKTLLHALPTLMAPSPGRDSSEQTTNFPWSSLSPTADVHSSRERFLPPQPLCVLWLGFGRRKKKKRKKEKNGETCAENMSGTPFFKRFCFFLCHILSLW